MRPLLARTLAVGVSGLVALLLVEAALHALRPPVEYQYAPQTIEVSHFRPSDLLPYELRASHESRFRMLEFDTTVRTNRLGLRDDEVDMGKPRVLCLGDSFTFGFGVEGSETFCAGLERLFDGRYDFVNAGFADGNAPDTYAVWLARHRDALAPRAVLVSVFQNDVGAVAQHHWTGDAPASGAPPTRIVEPGTIVTPDGAWLRDTAIAQWPAWARSWLKQSYVVALIRDRVLKDVPSTPEADLPAALESPAPPSPSARSPKDARFLAALEMLRVASGNTPLFLHLIPRRGQAYPSPMDVMVQEFTNRHGIPVVLDYAAFSESDYFVHDGHWNVNGHAKAARALHDALAGMGF